MVLSLYVDAEPPALGDQLVHFHGEIKRVHVREALHVVEVVVPNRVRGLGLGVRG